MRNLAYSLHKTGSAISSVLDSIPSGTSNFIQQHINCEYGNVNILSTTTEFNIRSYSKTSISNLVNLKRINDLRELNSFFETVNLSLSHGGIYIGCFESKEQRKKRIFEKFYTPIAYSFYCLDFVWKRVFPKLPVTKKFYNSLTRGHNRVLSLPEVLGRFISYGFEIVDLEDINNITYFAIRKINKPAYDSNPTYGPLIGLNRIGRHGEPLKVFKFRTMHPYSEYLQEYIYEKNRLKKGGKFKNDFRITRWGRFMRELWLDELPMIVNWLKGDIKLVGIRPLSNHYFELYPPQFQERRKNYKPGLIPPFYVHLPKTLDEILASERKYLMEYDKHPYRTDFKYFFKSIYNIIVKRARSN